MCLLFQVFPGSNLILNCISHDVYIFNQNFLRIILFGFFFEANSIFGARLFNLSDWRFASDWRDHLYERPAQRFLFLLDDAISSYSYGLISLSLCWFVELISSCQISRCLSLTFLSLVISSGLVVIKRWWIDGLLLEWFSISLASTQRLLQYKLFLPFQVIEHCLSRHYFSIFGIHIICLTINIIIY